MNRMEIRLSRIGSWAIFRRTAGGGDAAHLRFRWCRLWVGVMASVLRCGFVREDLVEGHVVLVHAIHAIGDADHQRAAQITEQRTDRDVHNVVTKAATVGPAAWNQAAVAERILNLALEHVAAKDAKTRVTGVVWIGRMIGTPSGKAHLRCGKIYFY